MNDIKNNENKKRNRIFISHATPEDNDFARWLSLKLIGLGYNVWCDIINLKGGDDWWPIIENEIRNNSVKFLSILTKHSNNRDGVLKELAVAQKVKKALHDSRFIIPLHLDRNLSHDDVNIELNRLNSINFKNSWANGLNDLIIQFDESGVDKQENNYDFVSKYWSKTFLNDRTLLDIPEDYYSNWFQIIELPNILRFHNFKDILRSYHDITKFKYPVFLYKDYLATFAWCYDFMEDLSKSSEYSPEKSYEFNVKDIIDGTFENRFINCYDAKRIIVALLNNAYDKTISAKKVEKYLLSNKYAFWIRKSIIHKGKFNKVKLIGKQKNRSWHFGISGHAKLYPEPIFVINSHILFTYDGENIIEETGIQHAARRKQGRNWWNNDWRSKLLAFVSFLADDGDSIHLQLGSEEIAKISITPITFSSKVSYSDPNIENLPDDQTFYEENIENYNFNELNSENET